MKFFSTTIFLLLLFWGCSSTESTVQELEQNQPEETVEESSVAPSWYSSGIAHSSDSLYVHGFALVSSSDSTEALTLAREISTQNLRYKIDEIVEDIRMELVETERRLDFDSPSFIREVRNGVRMLPLDNTDFIHEYEVSDGQIFYVYAKSSLHKDRLPNLLEDYIANSRFVEELAR